MSLEVSCLQEEEEEEEWFYQQVEFYRPVEEGVEFYPFRLREEVELLIQLLLKLALVEFDPLVHLFLPEETEPLELIS